MYPLFSSLDSDNVSGIVISCGDKKSGIIGDNDSAELISAMKDINGKYKNETVPDTDSVTTIEFKSYGGHRNTIL